MTSGLALVVDETGATLESGTHNTIVLVHADGQRERVGLRALGSVVLLGDVRLSTGVLQALAAQGVALSVFSQRGRAPAVGFTRMPNRLPALRHQQHLAYADATRRLELSRRIVWAKLAAMAEFARGHTLDRADNAYQAMHAAALEADIAGLMGVEGAATARHFDLLATLYKRGSPFRFNGRSRQPPQDEPNALMSLTYTLAEAQATQMAVRVGLDVQVGFLHAIHRDRQSLALDLIEPARAPIDGWVHGLLAQRGLLGPQEFSRAADGGVHLSKDGRRLFYRAWFREGHLLVQRPMRTLLARLLSCLQRHAPSGIGDAEDGNLTAIPVNNAGFSGTAE